MRSDKKVILIGGRSFGKTHLTSQLLNEVEGLDFIDNVEQIKKHIFKHEFNFNSEKISLLNEKKFETELTFDKPKSKYHK